jgi:hypothetical protein
MAPVEVMRVQLNFGDVPTWIASIGTVGALGAALIQINTERTRRHQQEAQKREDDHRAPAMLVAGLIIPQTQSPDDGEPARTPICLMNNAYAPVYRLVAGIVSVRGDGPQAIEDILQARQPGQPVPVTTISILPPGNSQVWIKNTERSGIADGRAGVEIAFTDLQGSHWIRRATGKLDEITSEPFEYYATHGLREPFEIQYPEPFSG